MKLNRDILNKLPLALRVEIEENAQRKNLSQTELAAEQRRILAELRKYKTPGARNDLKAGTSGNVFPEVRATDIVGRLYNESRKQVEKRRAVVDAAEAEPEKFGKLLDDMDRTGHVNGVHRRLKIARQAERIRAEPPPLPGGGPYRAGVADPPWQFDEGDEGSEQRCIGPYPRMTIEEICALPVASIMAPDSILWLWTTNRHLVTGEATKVLAAWGFTGKTMITWVKDRMGCGYWLRGQTEHVIMAVRGKPTVTLTNETTALHAPMRAHSQKPLEFYDLVERLCPAPRYAYLFSRYRHNDKWDCHGDEAPRAQAET
jgi:N6-adenosine-specific RNA methylase IME4